MNSRYSCFIYPSRLVAPVQGNTDSGIRQSQFPGFRNLLVESGIRNPESWALESGIQRKESGIPLTIGIWNPTSTDKEYYGIHGVESRI